MTFISALFMLGAVICIQSLIEQALESHVKELIGAEIRAQRTRASASTAPALARALALDQRAAALAPRRGHAAAVQAADGTILYRTSALFSPEPCPPRSPECGGWTRRRERAPDGPHEWLGHAWRLPDGGHLVIAYDILPMLDRLDPIPMVAGLGVFLVLLLGLSAGLHFGFYATDRIAGIRRAMTAFAHGAMAARTPVLGRQDEFDQLGEEINRTLARINQLMEEVRNATNHIAHELRTPLTRLQQRLSDIAQTCSAAPAVHGELARAQDEVQRIQSLFRSVMRISEIETGRCPHETVAIDTRALLDDVRDYYDALAEQRGIELRCRVAGTVALAGDRALLFQALVNLLDNALKYAPAQSTVTLLAQDRPEGIVLGVADQGPGIDAALRGVAVQRFHRLARDRAIPGNGLGLALVQAVAELHGGRLSLGDNAPSRVGAADAHAVPGRGLLAALHLPRPKASAAPGRAAVQR